MAISWKSFHPVVKQYLHDIGIQYLNEITAAQLNDLYDELDWDSSTGDYDEEVRNKHKLTKWILNKFPSYTHPDECMPHTAIVKASMKLRPVEQQAVAPPDIPAKPSYSTRSSEVKANTAGLSCLSKPLGQCTKEEVDAFVAAMAANNHVNIKQEPESPPGFAASRRHQTTRTAPIVAVESIDSSHADKMDIGEDRHGANSNDVSQEKPPIPFASKPGKDYSHQQRSEPTTPTRIPQHQLDSTYDQLNVNASNDTHFIASATEDADGSGEPSQLQFELGTRFLSVLELISVPCPSETHMAHAMLQLSEAIALVVIEKENLKAQREANEEEL